MTVGTTSQTTTGLPAFAPPPAAPPVFVSRGPRERLGRPAPWLPGSALALRELAEQAARAAADHRTPVLLVGERGTGKARLAGLLHARGARRDNPFVEVRCAALDAATAEALLARDGMLASAAGGTLFLSEVGALSAARQAELLEIVSGARNDVRVIAGSSRDLAVAITDGAFREDLYYRLSVMPLYLPPLRARAAADLVELAGDVFEELAVLLPEAPRIASPSALERLARVSWPGNVRELRLALERAMTAAAGADVLRPEHLPPELRGGDSMEAHEPRSLADVEREHVERTLRAHRGNRTHAARELGISRATLIKKVREYGLEAASRSRRTPEES